MKTKIERRREAKRKARERRVERRARMERETRYLTPSVIERRRQSRIDKARS